MISRQVTIPYFIGTAGRALCSLVKARSDPTPGSESGADPANSKRLATSNNALQTVTTATTDQVMAYIFVYI